MNFIDTVVFQWAVRCFGTKHVYDKEARALRLLEEAVELAQALGVPAEKCKLCVDVVYSRPVGVPEQELGGVMVCASLLGSIMSEAGMQEFYEEEVCRILKKSPEHFLKRNQEKENLGLK
jgi:hypothetical protein